MLYLTLTIRLLIRVLLVSLFFGIKNIKVMSYSVNTDIASEEQPHVQVLPPQPGESLQRSRHPRPKNAQQRESKSKTEVF